MDLCFQNFNFEKLKDMQHEFIKNLLAEVAASVSEIPALASLSPQQREGLQCRRGPVLCWTGALGGGCHQILFIPLLKNV